MKVTNQQIEELVLDGMGHRFSSADFSSLLRPGVYVLMAKDEPIYVGMGKNLLRRVSGNHHKRIAFKESTHMLLFPCRDVELARKLELLLITKCQPKFNVNKTVMVSLLT